MSDETKPPATPALPEAPAQPAKTATSSGPTIGPRGKNVPADCK